MAGITTALRRTFLLVLIAAVTGAALSRWRDRADQRAASPPVWPDFPDRSTGSTTPAVEASDPGGFRAPAWLVPPADGSPTPGFPVKVKESSGIYHVPGGRFYDRTRPDRLYADADAAEADGYRRSKS